MTIKNRIENGINKALLANNFNKQIKINAVTLTHKDFSELFRATNEQLLIRFRNYSATQQQQKRTVKRRYYKNLIVVFSYRILSFLTFTPLFKTHPDEQ